MVSNAQRFVVQEAAALDILTPTQKLILSLAARPDAKGRKRSVRGLCKGLGISHQAFYRTLKRAGVTLRRAVEIVETGDL